MNTPVVLHPPHDCICLDPVCVRICLWAHLNLGGKVKSVSPLGEVAWMNEHGGEENMKKALEIGGRGRKKGERGRKKGEGRGPEKRSPVCWGACLSPNTPHPYLSTLAPPQPWPFPFWCVYVIGRANKESTNSLILALHVLSIVRNISRKISKSLL